MATTIDRVTRWQVLNEAGFRCYYCGRGSREVVLEVDHVEPRSLGGLDLKSNLVAACFDCNRGKRDSRLAHPRPVVVITKDRGPGGNGAFTVVTTATDRDEFLQACATELCTVMEECWGDWDFTFSELLPKLCEQWARLPAPPEVPDWRED